MRVPGSKGVSSIAESSWQHAVGNRKPQAHVWDLHHACRTSGYCSSEVSLPSAFKNVDFSSGTAKLLDDLVPEPGCRLQCCAVVGPHCIHICPAGEQ